MNASALEGVTDVENKRWSGDEVKERRDEPICEAVAMLSYKCRSIVGAPDQPSFGSAVHWLQLSLTQPA